MSRTIRSLLAALSVGFGVLALAPGTAEAGVGASATPTFPTVVTLGDTGLPASIEILNRNTVPNANDVNTVCNFGDGFPCPAADPGITLIPSCGQLGAFSVCDPAGADPGVIVITGTPVGAVGSACPGMVFDVALIDPVFGQYRFTPQGGLHVTLPGDGALCRIDFTFDVLRMPTIDFPAGQAGLPGLQTVQVTDNTQHTGQGLSASARGTSDGTTVNRAQPTIATNASAGVQLGAGQLTDNATVSGRVNPLVGATVDFRLYGPDDATCAGTPVFESLGIAYPVAGGAVTSGAFVPESPGAYRWVASYSGEANNNPVAGACNDANENVTVAPSRPVPGRELPATGSFGIGGLLWTGAGLVAAGAALLAIFSRRRPLRVAVIARRRTRDVHAPHGRTDLTRSTFAVAAMTSVR